MVRCEVADKKKTLSKIIDVEKNYSFRPYSYTPGGVTPVLFYSDSRRGIDGA